MKDKRVRINEFLYDYISLIGKGNFKEGFNKILSDYNKKHNIFQENFQNTQFQNTQFQIQNQLIKKKKGDI